MFFLKLLVAFRPLGYQSTLSTPKKLLDCQTMCFFPCNGTVMVETSEIFDIALIGLDVETRIPSKPLSTSFRQGLDEQLWFFIR